MLEAEIEGKVIVFGRELSKSQYHEYWFAQVGKGIHVFVYPPVQKGRNWNVVVTITIGDIANTANLCKVDTYAPTLKEVTQKAEVKLAAKISELEAELAQLRMLKEHS